MKRFTAALAAVLLLGSASAYAAGAIAVDDEEGLSADEVGYGIATGEATREVAAAEAIRECRRQGNSGCKVAVRFDVCGAYVGNRRNYGVGWGNTKAQAIRMATDACGRNCKVVVAECE